MKIGICGINCAPSMLHGDLVLEVRIFFKLIPYIIGENVDYSIETEQHLEQEGYN